MENGFILLWRKIEYWDWYYDVPTLYLWLHILKHARHKPGFCNGTPLKVGQLVIGRKQIVEKLKKVGMTEQKFKTCMRRLVDGGEITTEPTTKGTIVTVTNWEFYQNPSKKSTTKTTIQQPTGNHPATTNNNDNNDTMKDVVGGSISNTLLQAVMDVWENPSKSLVSGVEKLAEEHGEASVIEALKTAVEYDTEGGVSLAYVKTILANNQKAKKSVRDKLHQAGLPTTEEPIEELIKKQEELIVKACKEGSATYSLYQQLKTLRDIQNPNRPRTKIEHYNTVVNGELRDSWREVEV